MKSQYEGAFGIQAYVSRPNFHRLTVFSPNLVAVELKNANIKIDRPIYAGATILELSKVIMYEFFYGFLKAECGEDFNLCYLDTEAFFLEFRGHDIYEIIKRNYDKFDTFEFDENNIFGIKRLNNKILGLMKDEAKGRIILKFVGLRSKMYCWRTKCKMKKVLKGIKSYVVNNKITFEDYESCLFNKEIVKCTQNSIRSKLHRVYSVRQTKVGLNPFDQKRYICKDGIHTLAFGHYKINTQNV